MAAATATQVQGYFPFATTAGAGFTINIAAGVADCYGTLDTYAGGTLTAYPSSTTKVYFNCTTGVPARKAGNFQAADIPIASVVSNGSGITSIKPYPAIPLQYVTYSFAGSTFSGLTGDTYSLTTSADFLIPSVNSFVGATAGEFVYDPMGQNYHGYNVQFTSDVIFAAYNTSGGTTLPTSFDCAYWTINSSAVGLGDAGTGCGDVKGATNIGTGSRMAWFNSSTLTVGTSTTTCASTANPADCTGGGGRAAGAVVIAAGATSVVVNTSAVTANSEIYLQDDESLGTKLSVTCDTTSGLTRGTIYITARTAGTSFTIGSDVATVTNPRCISFLIAN